MSDCQLCLMKEKKVVKRNKDCYRDCSCWELMSIDWYPVFSALTGNTCFFKICVKKIILIKITFWILKQINGWGLVLTCFFSLWRIETWIPFLSTPSCYLYCTDETRKWWIEYIADSTHLLKSTMHSFCTYRRFSPQKIEKLSKENHIHFVNLLRI